MTAMDEIRTHPQPTATGAELGGAEGFGSVFGD